MNLWGNKIYEKGARNIAFFCPKFERNIYAKRRHVGISNLKNKYGDCNLEVVTYEGSSSVESGFMLMKNYLSNNQKLPDAIMAFNDVVAVGIIRCLQEHKISVPDDVMVTGFDNLETILFPLDTVDIPVFDMGISASKLLFERIKNPHKEKEHIVLDAKIISRK